MTAFNADMYFSRLASQQAAQRFLADCYVNQGLNEAESGAYSNAQAFLHYIMHGRDLFEQGQQLPQTMQPLLFFYGAANLVKACLLTVCPGYPEQTAQLAHGVSARKIKKRDYTFLEDEVRIQHRGLFPCLAKYLFGISQFPEPRVKMKGLLGSIPEMTPLFRQGDETLLTRIGSCDSPHISLPNAICESQQATWKTIIYRLTPYLPPIREISEHESRMELTLDRAPGFLDSPRFATAEDGSIYIHLHKSPEASLSEFMIHYLLLYNLSMLSRYETEWWGELFALKSDMDYQSISVYLKVAAQKLPVLAARWLNRLENEKTPLPFSNEIL